MNKADVDSYLRDGCGRCDKYQTPECKVHRRPEVLRALRALLTATELDEELKWGSPCYTLNGKNVLMLTSLVDHCSVSFFKGAALVDDEGLLAAPGPNSRIARVLRFRSADEVGARRDHTERLVRQAIALERAGTKVKPAGDREPMPDELSDRLAADPDLMRAFAALTPGRQRSHILHVGGAKQTETRTRRVERCVPKIVAGKGFNER